MRAIIAAVSTICLVGVAQADMFTHTLTWSDDHADYGHLVTQANPFTYHHNVLEVGVNIPAGDRVTEAELMLTFIDDDDDESGTKLPDGTKIKWDNREHVRYAFDGDSWFDLPGGDVDTGPYSIILDIDWLNDDGILDVSVAVWNPFGVDADIYLRSSTLSGEFTPVPLPAAALLGMLGLGVAGATLRRQA